MSCYARIKKTLEKGDGVKVEKSKEVIIIKQNNEVLTTYNLKFVDYSKNNANNFIDYWKYRLNIRK